MASKEEEAGYLYSIGSYLGNKLYENTVGYFYGSQMGKAGN